MTFNPPETGPPGRRPFTTPRKRPKALIPTLVILVLVILSFSVLTSFLTDLLWFRSVDYANVFTTQLTTRIVLFAVFALLMALFVALNIAIAYRLRPAFRGMSPEQQNLDRYRVSIDPYRVWLLLGVSALLGMLAGTAAAGEWRTWLQWRNGTSFGVKDPQFGKDVSFYVFDYPWWRFILGFFFAVVLVSLLAAVATHYLYGGLRLQTPGEKSTPAAQAHISVLLGVFVLLKAVAYWLDRYGLAVHGGGFERVTGWTGLRYRDVNALLPAKTILVGIALVCAVLFFANVWRRTWMLPGIGLGLLVLSAVLIGGVYPAIVQQFQVRPSEVTREAPFIDRNIQATRAAYGLADATVSEYDAKTTAQAGALRANANTAASIRLLDPNIVSPTFQQQQQIRGFYSFPDTLKIDRYRINGKDEDVVAAVRELNLGSIPPEQRNWISDHLIFTHGYGFVAARGNNVNADGGPNYVSSGISNTSQLGEYEPRIYFGEESPAYSIVGREDGENREFDYPDDTQPNGQSNNTYAGEGGVKIGSFWKQMLYAVKFREQKILLSSDVDAASKILYIRDPRERIGKVAPWLTLDGNPYPAIIDGRIKWIVDGYTSSANYPYASRTTLGEATETILTTADRRVIAPRDEVNYIRNSVKATVDAYDGNVSLYTWDDQDPVLKTWKKAFPNTVKERAEISPALMSHLRYPEDLFKVQRELMARYHVTDAETFYGRADFWQVPRDPGTGDSQVAIGVANDTTEAQPPYYLTLQMPGQDAPTFSLTTAFEPAGRQTLSAFMAVNATPGEDYGKIRVLQLPRNTTVPGPRQVQNEIKADPGVNAELLALRVGNKVTFGNLLTLPVGGGLLYVEPLYVQAATGTSFPLLQQVIVSFGDNIAIGRTLGEALDKVFEGDSGVTTPDEQPTPGNGGQTPGSGQNVNTQIAAAIEDARKAFSDGEAALAKGDFAAYGKAQDRLEAALQRAENLQNRRGGGNGGAGADPPPAPTPVPEAPPEPTPPAGNT